MFTTSLDLRATEPGEWELLAPLKWSAAESITVPAGFITDLASLPRLVRPVLDRNGLSRRPAVLHDWLYCLKTGSRADADKLFLEALKTEGAGLFEFAGSIAVQGSQRGRPMSLRSKNAKTPFGVLLCF